MYGAFKFHQCTQSFIFTVVQNKLLIITVNTPSLYLPKKTKDVACAATAALVTTRRPRRTDGVVSAECSLDSVSEVGAEWTPGAWAMAEAESTADSIALSAAQRELAAAQREIASLRAQQDAQAAMLRDVLSADAMKKQLDDEMHEKIVTERAQRIAAERRCRRSASPLRRRCRRSVRS